MIDENRSAQNRGPDDFSDYSSCLRIGAGFVAPYNPVQQDRDRPYAPPTAIHFVDASRKFHIHPFVYLQRAREGSFDQYEDDHASRIPVKFFVTGAPYRLLGIIPGTLHLLGAEGASVNLLGTDGYGRDLFSRILYGGQISLLAGLLAASLSLLIGTFVGVHRAISADGRMRSPCVWRSYASRCRGFICFWRTRIFAAACKSNEGFSDSRRYDRSAGVGAAGSSGARALP